MSEYIPRLREELVSAAARERAGRRRRSSVRLRPIAVAAAVAAIAIALVLVLVLAIEVPNDEQPAELPAGTTAAYRAVPPEAAEAAADVLRARIAATGVEGVTIAVAGDQVGVEGPAEQVAPLTAPGVLGIYDWEASVLGPDGLPAPGDDAVTGGESPEGAAVSRKEAERRASLAPGRVHVVKGPGGWFGLAGPAAVGNADVARAMALREPATRVPAVAVELTTEGQARFHDVTREVAQRGARLAKPGDTSPLGSQHLALVVDDEIMSLPFIDYREAPDGIDGRDGAQIMGDMTPERARQVAAMLDSGPLPAQLEPVAP